MVARLEYEYSLSDFATVDPAESWNETTGAPAGYIMWAEYDTDGGFNPHEDYGTAKFYDASGHYTYDDCQDLRNAVRHGEDEGWGDERIMAHIVELCGAQAVRKFNFGDHGKGAMWAYLALTTFDYIGPPDPCDPVKWLTDSARIDEIASEWLDSEVKTFCTWSDGGVFMVYAANLITGEKSDGLFGIIDEYPYDYAKSQALEQCRELMS